MTFILSRIFGLYFIGAGLALLCNSKNFKKLCSQIAQNNSFCYLGGVISLFIGAFIVSVHNFWIMSWPVLITLIGWLSLLKGFWLLTCYKCFPIYSFMKSQSKGFYKTIGIIVILIGIFFAYKGWIY